MKNKLLVEMMIDMALWLENLGIKLKIFNFEKLNFKNFQFEQVSLKNYSNFKEYKQNIPEMSNNFFI